MTRRILLAMALLLLGSQAGAHIETSPGERDLAAQLAAALAAQPAAASCEMPEAAERARDGLPAPDTPLETLLARPTPSEATAERRHTELC